MPISRWIVIGVALLLLVLVSLAVWLRISRVVSPEDRVRHDRFTVTVGGAAFNVEVADEPDEWDRGLSGHSPLALDEGMLFLFDQPGAYGFWMKEMRFAIDVLWISDDLRVIGIERGFSPESYPEQRFPPKPIRVVLEIPAGSAERRGLDIGAAVDLSGITRVSSTRAEHR